MQNLITLALLFSIMLLLFQRTERKRKWLTALVLLLPAGLLIYRWAIYRQRLTETLVAAGIGVGLNLLFWLIYGRRHPPGSSDEITVIGMED